MQEFLQYLSWDIMVRDIRLRVLRMERFEKIRQSADMDYEISALQIERMRGLRL